MRAQPQTFQPLTFVTLHCAAERQLALAKFRDTAMFDDDTDSQPQQQREMQQPAVALLIPLSGGAAGAASGGAAGLNLTEASLVVLLEPTPQPGTECNAVSHFYLR